MAEISRKFDVEKLISYSDDLVKLLKDEKDINDLNHCVEKSDALRSRCRSDHAGVQSSLEAITNQIKDLEEQRSSIEERRQVLKKLKQDEAKAQMTLSMYASVTRIIPDLNDKSKISGRILCRVCLLDSNLPSSFCICNSLIRQSQILLTKKRKRLKNSS
ncbi:hypothetical protein L6452_35313 [Arctium lappa]|uniref:Uncharacterized protein n=1 Tax=Arctium lappa TaxID=4217 RepID=A0ACB8Y6T0_ARCLA|nr:hypothetical protein L6452_35313 [Arctium lappa]